MEQQLEVQLADQLREILRSSNGNSKHFMIPSALDSIHWSWAKPGGSAAKLTIGSRTAGSLRRKKVKFFFSRRYTAGVWGGVVATATATPQAFSLVSIESQILILSPSLSLASYLDR